ncbi:CDP-glycerol glycerophosphotransferase family protein [Candidatus Hydrogenedentota bacterium]
MASQLIVVESGVEESLWRDFLRNNIGAGETLILFESRISDVTKFETLGVRCACFSDYVGPSSELEGQLIEQAETLYDRFSSCQPITSISDILKHGELPLLNLARFRIEFHVLLPFLIRYHVFEALLSADEWRNIQVLSSRGTLANILKQVLSNLLLDKSVEEKMCSPARSHSSMKARICERFAPGAHNPLLKCIADLKRLMKSGGPSRVRSADDGETFLFVLPEDRRIYLDTASNVIEKLKEEGRVIVITAGTTKVSDAFQETGMPLYDWIEQIPLVRWLSIGHKCRQLKQCSLKLREQHSLISCLEYKGKKLWPAIASSLEEVFTYHLPQMVAFAESLKYVFETVRPSSVVTLPDRCAPARVALALAKLRQVPSLTIQATLLSDHPRHGPMCADKGIVVDDFGRRIFTERGEIDPKRLVIAGLPRWDKFVNTHTFNKHQDIRQSLDLAPDEKLVVFATQPIPLDRSKEMLMAVKNAMEHHSDLRLAIKIHPAEPIERYELLLGRINWKGPQPIIVTDVDLHALLVNSEILITGFSNVALEAALLGVPALVINLTGEPDPLPFVEQGLATGAYSADEVVQAFSRLIDNPESFRARQRDYFERNPQLIDGRASERVVEVIREMTHN